MSFKRTFAPAIANAANVKSIIDSLPSLDGTAKSNKVAEGDLRFWIPLATAHLSYGIPRVQTLEELVRLPKAHIGHILAAILPIYRQKRSVNGKRYTNASLKLKVEAWQRVIRGIYAQEYNVAVLEDPNTPVKTFNVYSDPELRVLVEVLNKEMEKSAYKGLTTGIQKRKRSLLTPKDLKAIFQL